VSATTGNAELDRMTGGLLRGWFWLVGANTNVGKSSWAVAVADENLQRGIGVVIVSLEDPESLYGDRLMLRRCYHKALVRGVSPVSADRLRLGKLTPEDHVLMADVAADAERKPIFLDARSLKGERIAREIGDLIDSVEGIEVIIVDYLQEIYSEGAHHSVRDKVSEMCRGIREVVKARDRCLVVTSQVTVEDPDKWPRRHQIRDSRDVVNAAEVVLMLGIAHSDVVEKRRDGSESLVIPEGDKGALVDKCKQGLKGFVRLGWSDEAACYTSDRVDVYSDCFGEELT
jgi:replicative DNA helicase